MGWTNTPEDEATRVALMRGLALVLVPGLIFVGGLIWLVSPRYVPPSQAWANGTYVNPCCDPLILRDGSLSSGSAVAHYTVAEDKRGYYIELDRGIGLRGRAVEFGRNFQYVPFNDNSEALPAIHDARALHLTGLDDSNDYIFVKR
jgi:hypothetical protein